MSITGLSPYLYYEEADAALRWLERVLGFGPAKRWLDPDGVLQEADIDVGNAHISISARAPGPDDGRGALLIVHVDDIDARHRRAVEEAGVPVSNIERQPYGPQSFNVTDPWGYKWYVWEGEVSPAPGWTEA
ncbi:glyoxalase/bleomycin resistance/extradiol dioxygenase family protein [Antrihabitans sp. YC2-6]|uniref:VOC family protein n=1 Tax=Antrihabitans sp. YC2-6 TaxID=2799498 RepID=UPI0018F6DE78|nr:VOC family protein [Antrihabitans sp. YC2-6]MBJ8345897.1 VOC family protein [Antrihabitans sp. YC2-6]